MLILNIILIIFLFFILKLSLFKNKYLKTIFKYLTISLILSTLIETFAFNYRHFESLTYDKIKPTYTLNNLSCNDSCKATDEDAYIEISNLNQKVSNLYLDFSSAYTLALEISIKDTGHKLYYSAGKTSYTANIPESKYLKIHAYKNMHSLKITFKNTNDFNFKINNIYLNAKVPFMFSAIRSIFMSLIFFLILCFNPKSIFHEIKYNAPIKKIILPITIIAVSLVFLLLPTLNTFTNNLTAMHSNQSQYKNLAEALANHHLSLDLKVSPKLQALTNPYDREYRDSLLKVNKDYYWDYAYYQGKYYSYFGIVPCLLIYLPSYLITNTHIANHLALSISSILFVISGFYLIYELINKYFKNTSLPWYLLLTIFYIFGTGLLYALGSASFYYIPLVMGSAFASFSFGFFLKATNSTKLHKKYLFLGSLSFALIAGCRPQMLVIALLILVLLWDYIFKKRALFSKKSWRETLCLVLPVLVIALLLMAYNYARFSNIFDFGANYNLTSNDMTTRGFNLDRLLPGFYYYLFAPLNFVPKFPYLANVYPKTTYLGKTICDNFTGGFFMGNLICLLSLFAPKFKNILKNKELSRICMSSLFGVALIIIADTQMAGILNRYILDFSPFLLLVTIIIILSLLQNTHLNINISKIIYYLIILSLLYNALTFFHGEYLFKNNNNLYQKLYYLFSLRI